MGNENSKEIFQQGCDKLCKEICLTGNHQFWKPMFKNALSIEDIYLTLTPKFIKTMYKKYPENLGALIFKVF
jgi:hypothetical protein